MSAKVVLALCASALFVQAISAACIGTAAPAMSIATAPASCTAIAAPTASTTIAAPMITPSLSYSFNMAVPTSGGAFGVTSSSPLAPTGLSVQSNNAMNGELFVAGTLPFKSAVAMEGQMPSAGSGAVSYSCGDGVGIVSEGVVPSYAAPMASAAIANAYAGNMAGLAGYNFGNIGFAGRGCGMY